ncbi:alpha/beta hydrolase [Candidatus Marinamargulisbacteria bacterium SCGC AAA071-K20]|nr:alpha/beta hydrolase [Candidatus Marinamargulisbacteria bacterium SCGC AAA071-K20]
MQYEKIFYQETGDGKTLVFLHGLFGSSDNWIGIAKKLSKQFRCILIDLPNHGKSEWTNQFTYSTLAEDLHEFIQHHQLTDFNILGHSMGGKIVMQYLHNFPGSVNKSIIVDIAPKTYEPSHTFILETLKTLPLQNVSSLKEAFEHLNKRLKDDALSFFLLKSLNITEGRAEWKINLDALINNYQDILAAPTFTKSINTPTLFIRGLDSDYIQNNDKPLIRESFSTVSFKDIENTGHWLHAQKPDLVVNSIEKFLN